MPPAIESIDEAAAVPVLTETQFWRGNERGASTAQWGRRLEGGQAVDHVRRRARRPVRAHRPLVPGFPGYRVFMLELGRDLYRRLELRLSDKDLAEETLSRP